MSYIIPFPFLPLHPHSTPYLSHNPWFHMIDVIVDGMISPCQSLLDEMQGKSLHGAYIPQCTDQGEFDSMQCWGSTGECWCVTEAGAEIDNTRTVRPDQPQCDDGKCLVLPSRGQPGASQKENDEIDWFA